MPPNVLLHSYRFFVPGGVFCLQWSSHQDLSHQESSENKTKRSFQTKMMLQRPAQSRDKPPSFGIFFRDPFPAQRNRRPHRLRCWSPSDRKHKVLQRSHRWFLSRVNVDWHVLVYSQCKKPYPIPSSPIFLPEKTLRLKQLQMTLPLSGFLPFLLASSGVCSSMKACRKPKTRLCSTPSSQRIKRSAHSPNTRKAPPRHISTIVLHLFVLRLVFLSFHLLPKGAMIC